MVKFIRDAYRREPGPTLRKSSKYLVNFRRRSGGSSSSYPGGKTFGDGRLVQCRGAAWRYPPPSSYPAPTPAWAPTTACSESIKRVWAEAAASPCQFALIPGFAARSLRDRIFRILHGSSDQGKLSLAEFARPGCGIRGASAARAVGWRAVSAGGSLFEADLSCRRQAGTAVSDPNRTHRSLSWCLAPGSR